MANDANDASDASATNLHPTNRAPDDERAPHVEDEDDANYRDVRLARAALAALYEMHAICQPAAGELRAVRDAIKAELDAQASK